MAQELVKTQRLVDRANGQVQAQKDAVKAIQVHGRRLRRLCLLIGAAGGAHTCEGQGGRGLEFLG